MSRTNVWLIAIVVAIAGALVGGGAVWAMQNAGIATLTARVAASDAQTQALRQQVAVLQATQVASSALTASAGTTTATPAVKSKAAPVPKIVVVKQFAFVKKVNVTGSRPVITADYALMLTGTAAAKAATAHGDESPPPNDYYIVNDNPLLRKRPVKSGITVTVTSNEDGTSDPPGHISTFAKWAAAYAAPDSANAALREAPYWLTLKNGVVTKIVEQYLP